LYSRLSGRQRHSRKRDISNLKVIVLYNEGRIKIAEKMRGMSQGQKVSYNPVESFVSIDK